MSFNTLKKYAVSVGAVVSGLAVAGFAKADSIITLPGSATAELYSTASQILTDVWVLVAIAIGIPLGFYIIKKVIGLIPKR